MGFDALWLALSALGAGVLNAVAGGGSFLTLPALLFTGMAPIAANATSAVAVSPGYLGSTWGFRQELKALPRARLVQEAGLCGFAGLAGSGLLLLTPAKLFTAVVPWLLLFATTLFVLGPRLAARRGASSSSGSRWRWLGLCAVGVYGGYFNGGLGILLMALYSSTGERDLNTANALKNLNSLVLSLVSVAAFAWAGVVAWPQALGMALVATLGGYVGARWARRLPARTVRAVVVLTGLVMSALFFLR